MALVECPKCGASKGLKGAREEDGIHMRCRHMRQCVDQAPGRLPEVRRALLAFRAPLLHEARGTEQSILA